MEHIFKYKGNLLTVESNQSREEARTLAVRISKALKSVAGLQGKKYELAIEMEENTPVEPVAKPVSESKKKK